MRKNVLKLFLSAVLCVSLTANAQQVTNLPSDDFGFMWQRSSLPPVEMPEALWFDSLESNKSIVPETPAQLQTETELRNDPFSLSILDETFPTLHRKARSAEDLIGKHRLDSMIGYDNFGNLTQHTVYVYDHRQRPIRQINRVPVSGELAVHSQIEMEWNDNDFMTQLIRIYPLGQREGFKERYTTHNELGFPTTIYAYRHILAQNRFEFLGRRMRTYDEHGRLIEIRSEIPVGDGWQPAFRGFLQRNEEGRIIYDRRYDFVNGNWVGSYRVAFKFREGPLFYSFTHWDWDTGINYWTYRRNYEQTFLPGFTNPSKLASITRRYWNRERNDWSGNGYSIDGIMFRNVYVTMTFDAEGRRLNELVERDIDGVITRQAEQMHIWQFPTDGTWEEIETINLYVYSPTTGARRWNQQSVHKRQNARRATSVRTSIVLDGVLTHLSEVEETFHPVSRESTEIRRFGFSAQQNRTPTYRRFRIFEGGDSGAGTKLLNLISYRGSTDPENPWIFDFIWYHQWENDMIVRSARYTYHSGIGLRPAWGSGFDMDFNVPRSELVVFLDTDYDSDYKLLRRFELTGLTSGGNDFWGLAPVYLHWNQVTADDLIPPTSIVPPASGLISIFPNPVADSFTISGLTESALVRITDLNGRIVFEQTVSPNENILVSHLSAGVYFVRVNDEIIRIIKQ